MSEVLSVVILITLALVALMQIIIVLRISRLEQAFRKGVAIDANSVGQKEERAITKKADKWSGKSSEKSAGITPEKSAGLGLFEQFISEDVKRIALTKREQAEAFREWRKQRGVTWKAGENEVEPET